jgi:hypothetical protein
MELDDLWIRPCTNMADVKDFIVKHHYSQSIKGITPFLSFEVVSKTDYQRQLGAAIFGVPGQASTELLYGEYEGSKQTHRPWVVAVELRRFVLLDELPKNSESYLLSRMLQRLEVLGVERIISYADPQQMRPDHPDRNHTGLIYSATGFHMVNQVKHVSSYLMTRDFEMGGKVFKEGRRIPRRNFDQYKNYRGMTIDDVENEQFRQDWKANISTGKSVSWVERSTGKNVFIVKIPAHLTSLSKRLRAAVSKGAAVIVPEAGKILWVKDLQRGMVYVETPSVSMKDLRKSTVRPKES